MLTPKLIKHKSMFFQDQVIKQIVSHSKRYNNGNQHNIISNIPKRSRPVIHISEKNIGLQKVIAKWNLKLRLN